MITNRAIADASLPVARHAFRWPEPQPAGLAPAGPFFRPHLTGRIARAKASGGCNVSYSPRIACLFNAIDLAMTAKVADVDGAKLRELVSEAGQVLAADDPARAAVLHFATQHEIHGFDPDQVIVLGHQLHDAISRALRPDPVDADRKDIHG